VWHLRGLFSVRLRHSLLTYKVGGVTEPARVAVHDDGVYLCNTCGHDLELNGRKPVPKFSGANWVNKSLCQHRPSVFDDLTLVERQVIARCHLVGYVIRLSRGTNAGNGYRGARGHIIAFKQDPSELLSILPSPDLRLSNVITVSWDGAAEPSRENLRKFCAIRKQKVAGVALSPQPSVGIMSQSTKSC
jgi:uncharacterized protein DUF6570